MLYMLAQETSVGDWPQQWKDTFLEAMREVWTTVGSFAPKLVGMLVILVVGYIVSRLLQRLAHTVLQRIGFEKASEKIRLRGLLDRAGIRATASAIVGKLVFWLFMLTFLISAAEALGLENVSQTIHSFVAYVPNVIGAAVIVVVGLLLAHFVSDLVGSGAQGIGVEYARALAKLTYGVLVVVVGALAIGQLQIETALLNRVVEIVLIAAGAALALALGLGTRDVARNIVAGVYARDLYKPGTHVTVADEEGTLRQVGTITTSIETARGRLVHIPNGKLVDAVVTEQPAGQ